VIDEPGLAETLEAFEPQGEAEARDLGRARALAGSGDPWGRGEPLHVTASALVLHPPTGRVLLRWHDRLQRWLHVGGHADPGEDRPVAIALREAVEETGLADLGPWPVPLSPWLVQVAVVPVPATAEQQAHEHADLRYVLATHAPEQARQERDTTPLRWLSLAAAIEEIGGDNLGVALRRVAGRLGPGPDGRRPPG
jgi:8-oxo-dGTP pyrophosphatase MutT (NUDIX family)